MLKPIRRHLLVAVPVQNIGVNIAQFPDVQVLRDKEIVGIETYEVADVNLSPDGLALVNNTVFEKAFLTLQDLHGVKDIQQIPLVSLSPSRNAGKVKEFATRKFDLAQCFVSVGSIASLVLNEVFLFSIYYIDPTQDCK